MKLKSLSSAKKRVKFSGKGKIRMQKSAKKHLLINKSKRQKKALRGGKSMTLANQARIKRLLPYN